MRYRRRLRSCTHPSLLPPPPPPPRQPSATIPFADDHFTVLAAISRWPLFRIKLPARARAHGSICTSIIAGRTDERVIPASANEIAFNNARTRVCLSSGADDADPMIRLELNEVCRAGNTSAPKRFVASSPSPPPSPIPRYFSLLSHFPPKRRSPRQFPLFSFPPLRANFFPAERSEPRDREIRDDSSSSR